MYDINNPGDFTIRHEELAAGGARDGVLDSDNLPVRAVFCVWQNVTSLSLRHGPRHPPRYRNILST